HLSAARPCNMACATGAGGRHRLAFLRRIFPSVFFGFFVEKNALGRAFEIVILPGLQRPEKGDETQKAEQEGGGHQKDEYVHGVLRASPARFARLRRSEFSVTVIDELDMAMAATSGVT